MRRLPSLLLVVVVTSCSSGPKPEARFVHAIVPGLLADFANSAPSPAGPGASLSAFLETAGQLPGTTDVPDFVVIAAVSRDVVSQGVRDSVVARTVRTLQLSPTRRVFIVPVGAVRRDTSVWTAIVSRAAAADIAVKDLTSCYETDTLRDAGCTLDLEDTDVRIVGFPSLSATSDTSITKRVPKWVATLDTLVTHAGTAGRSAIVVTDVPDPTLWESAGIPAAAAARFNAIVATRIASLVGVRSSSRAPRSGRDRVVETPLLSSSTPSDSALGFTLVRVREGTVAAQPFRRRVAASSFAASPGPAREVSRLPRSTAFGSLRALAQSPELLAVWTVIAIATILAFLTIVQLWEVPPPTGSASGATGGGPSSTGSDSSVAAPSTTGLFKTNMGRAVGAGLAGLGAVAFLDELWKTAGFNAKALYVVSFVEVFLIILIGSAVIRGIGEAWRHWIVTLPLQLVGQTGLGKFRRFRLWVRRNFKSLGATGLVWYDTFFAVIQGKNQFQSTVWTNTIFEHHRAILAAAEAIRAGVESHVRDVLSGQHPGPRDVRVNLSLENETQTALYYVKWTPGSLQTEFGTKSVAYLAVASGQPLWWKDGYPDVALIENSDDKASSFRKQLPKGDLKLSDYFEYRPSRDYDAFLVIPFPLRSRTVGQGRRGGLHFSFATKALIDGLIEHLEDTAGAPNYGCCHHLFEVSPQGKATCETKKAKTDCTDLVHFKDQKVASAIEQGLEVLQFLFAAFNDDVYNEYRSQL